MKKFFRGYFLKIGWAFVLPLLAFTVAPAAHATATPSLGAADPFALLTYAFARNGSPGVIIIGDLGYTTTTSPSGHPNLPSVSGSTHVSDSTYTQAETDEHTTWVALGDASIYPCTATLPPLGSSVDLATQDVGSGVGIYPPGVYCTSMAISTVTIGSAGITLDGQGLYIFRFNGALLATDPNSSVTLKNNASACDVFWLPSGGGMVSSFGHDSTFVGTVFAHDGYTVQDAVTWFGRAITVIGGTISMASDDSITVPTGCSAPTTGTLHVIKTFYNDYGGTAVPSDAMVHVKNGAGDVAGSPHAGAVSPGTSYTLNVGTYTVSEDSFSGYTPTFSGDCDVSGHVTLASGDNKTCTISNDQNPPAPATLHVIKHVVNNNGGTATASSFLLHVKGTGGMGVSEVSGSPAAGVESPGTSYSLAAGAYAVSENASTGYTSSFSGDCDSAGNITLSSGANRTCTITNDDTATTGGGTGGTSGATLHVVKIVINDNGGHAAVSDAIVHVTNGGLGDVAGSPHAGTGSPGTSYSLAAGTYTVSENFFPGYTVKIGGDCTDSGTVTLVSGDNKTCTITNNDIAGLIVPTTTSTTSTTTTTPTSVPPSTPPTSKPPCDVCTKLTYDLYIINPNGSERHTGTPWVRITDRGNGIKRYSFEDATLDPHNPLYDYNDSVIDVDFTDCKNVKFMFVSSDASWKHQVRIKVSINGVTQSDTLVTNDSIAVVGTIKTVDSTSKVNTTTACRPVSRAVAVRACTKAALDTMNAALKAGSAAYNAAIKSGKAIYNAAIKSASALPDKTARKNALAAAKNVWKAAQIKAQSNLKAAKKAAQDQYKAALAACKAIK